MSRPTTLYLITPTHSPECKRRRTSTWLLTAPEGEPARRQGLEDLLETLLHGPLAGRRQAAMALKTAGQAGIEALVMALRAGDESVQVLAVLALEHLKAAAVEPLIGVLREGPWQAQQRVIWALQRIGDERAVLPLIETLEDRNTKTRRYAASALGYFQDMRAIAPLIACFADSVVKVRFDAGMALAQLARGGPPLREAVAEALAAAEAHPDDRIATYAARVLGWVEGQPDHAQPLIAALRSSTEEARWRAAWSLGWLGEPLAVEPLIAALDDPSPIVQAQAAAALGWIGDPRATSALLMMLPRLGERDEWVLRAAIDALERLGDIDLGIIGPLRIFSGADQAPLRQAAEGALRRLGFRALHLN